MTVSERGLDLWPQASGNICRSHSTQLWHQTDVNCSAAQHYSPSDYCNLEKYSTKLFLITHIENERHDSDDVAASGNEERKVGSIRYEARSRGRSSPDTLAF